MKIIHFRLNDDPTIRFGCLRENCVVDATDLIEFDTSKPCGGINDRFNMDGEMFEKILERSCAPTTHDVESIQLLAPVPRPGKVFCIDCAG